MAIFLFFFWGVGMGVAFLVEAFGRMMMAGLFLKQKNAGIAALCKWIGRSCGLESIKKKKN